MSEAEARRLVDTAYRLVLRREPDSSGRDGYARGMAAGVLSIEDVVGELARSEEFMARFDATQAPGVDEVDDHRFPAGVEMVDAEELARRYSAEELADSADAYFREGRRLKGERMLAKPLDNVTEAPDILIGFSQLLAELRPVPGMRVLDFGAGTGWSSWFLTQLGCQVVALDISPAALELARDRFERFPVVGDHFPPEFLVFDGERFDLPDGSIDRVLCLEALHHVANPAQVLAEMARVLRDGGEAGFSEPGPDHSRMGQSQWEMKNNVVIERDILMGPTWDMARRAGFTSLRLGVFSARPFFLDLDDYRGLLRFGPQLDSYAEHVREFALERRLFVLRRGEELERDSRDRTGLAGRLEVTPTRAELAAGRTFSGHARAENLGSHRWLPSDAQRGPVLLGVHLRDRDGTLLDLDYERIAIPTGSTGVPPGESVSFDFEVSVPGSGEYVLEFDLVAEGVCWFEHNGCRTVPVVVTAPT